MLGAKPRKFWMWISLWEVCLSHKLLFVDGWLILNSAIDCNINLVGIPHWIWNILGLGNWCILSHVILNALCLARNCVTSKFVKIILSFFVTSPQILLNQFHAFQLWLVKFFSRPLEHIMTVWLALRQVLLK